MPELVPERKMPVVERHPVMESEPVPHCGVAETGAGQEPGMSHATDVAKGGMATGDPGMGKPAMAAHATMATHAHATMSAHAHATMATTHATMATTTTMAATTTATTGQRGRTEA